jgi:3-phenylpropionate/trans-cinnamate dioxygenase ferredoxin subunit
MTGHWLDVGAADELAAGGRIEADVGGTWVTIVRVGDELYAFEDRCTHDGQSLAGGEIERDAATGAGVVVCPRHGARFCLATGEPLCPPAYEPLRRFEVRRNAGRIEVLEA